MTKVLALTLILAACGVAQDAEITPRWDMAPNEEALAVWVDEVQGVVDSWQTVLGENCQFPLWIGPHGSFVSLVAVEDWTYRGAVGMYDQDDGSVYVEGRLPKRDGTTYTLGHELGHAAGLHHSTDRNSIMSADAELTHVPTAVDGAALRRLLGCSKG